MEDKWQIDVSYHFDQYLMYLIQDVSRRPPAEILAFFYELAGQVSQIGGEAAQKNCNRSMRKQIVDYFPGTSIPFLMKVTGHRVDNHQRNPHNGSYVVVGHKFMCYADLGFPESRTYIKEELLKSISEALMERALLDAPMDLVIPEFEKPEIKSPKMYKALMNTFLGREPEKRKSRKKESDGTTQTT